MQYTIAQLNEDVKANSKHFVKVEEGTFTCRIFEINEGISQKGKPIVKITYEVTEGPCKTGRFIQYFSLGTDKSMYITASILANIATKIFGIYNDKIEEEASCAHDLITNAIAEITKRTKKENAPTLTVTRTQNGEYFNNKIVFEQPSSATAKNEADFFKQVEQAN